jgi:hypothetical protein
MVIHDPLKNVKSAAECSKSSKVKHCVPDFGLVLEWD